jgi:hypothetical protein
VQQPIPVWVAGRWPNRRPFRRAARWEGVFATHQGVDHAETMAPDELRDIIQYTTAFRTDDTPFDVVMEGCSDGSDSAAASLVAPYQALGLTWWVEKLGWFRGSLDEMRRRIAQGPPRYRLFRSRLSGDGSAMFLEFLSMTSPPRWVGGIQSDGRRVVDRGPDLPKFVHVRCHLLEFEAWTPSR